METLMIYAQTFFGWLLQTTLIASVVICLILLIQKMLGGKLGPRWCHALWLVLLIRMILPWAPSSRVSLLNLIPLWDRQIQRAQSSEATEQQLPFHAGQASDTAEAIPAQKSESDVIIQKKSVPEPGAIADIQIESKLRLVSLRRILPVLWLAGAIVIGAYLLVSNFALWRIVKRDRPLVDQPMLELFEECKAQMGVQSLVVVVPSSQIRSPALFGFIRPRLLLPLEMLKKASHEEMRYVFLHELAHMRRHDIYLGWLTSLLQVLHWFNPLIWFAFYRMRSDRELACDALVLARTQKEESQEYGQAIVSLVRRFSRSRPLPAMAGIIENKSQLKRRIAMIAQFKKNSYQWSPLAAVLIVILACISLPEAKRSRASGISAAKPSAIVIRQVWAQAGDVFTPSPDGRYLSYINWNTVELAVHDLKTGENRDLTDEGNWNKPSEYPDRSIWSPDSRQVAYCWYKGDDTELRIVDLDGSKPRVLCTSNPELEHAPLPHSWSQDGKYILALMGKKDESLERSHEDHIVLVSVTDGSLRVLKSLGARRTQYMSLSPDGRYVVFELTTEDPKKRDIYLLATDGSGEAHLVKHPADDWAPFWAPDGKRIVFVSDRMGSAGLWLLNVDDGKPKGAPTLAKGLGSNLGRLNGFTRDGSFYYDLMTPAYDIYVATLDFEAGKVLAPPTKVPSRFEGSNYAPLWSPDGKYLAYASKRRMSILIRSIESGQERELSPDMPRFLLPRGWAAARWSPDGGSILVNGIDREETHGLFLVDVQTGDSTMVVQNEPKKEGGESAARVVWPVFSNDGKLIYGVRGDRSIVVYNLETRRERELYRAKTDINLIYRLAISPDGRRLAFFEAAQALRPTVVKTMPTPGGEPSELYTLKEGKRFSWGVGLSWTPDGDHVVVGGPDDARDKPDVLWMIPAEGGEPRKLELAVKVNHLALHPDGRRIAVTRNEPGGGGDVWVMENFLPEGLGK
jgi:beta-lactamase regulating signal transducer with metallopeptidase domain/Tol biopolymer transport system component